ncbi:MAG: penicillin-binding protein [Candidatus Paceibacterota bacterium]
MKKKKAHFFRTAFLIFLIAGFFGTGVFLLWAASLKTPDLSSLETRKVEQSTRIYDRTGEILLFDLQENISRTIIPLEEMSRNIKNATVAIEDEEFYEHRGIKPTAILRAVIANILSLGFEQGGSTITQQVIKNSVLVRDKTIARKLKEWVLAVKLERAISKEEILELYLNEVPYGGVIYGIEEASRAYFGKGSNELSIAESAYLAALPQAPTYYSPYGNRRDALEARKNLVLSQMLKNNFITKTEYNESKEEEVGFLPQQDTGIKAPHFVFFVREYLEEKYGRRAVEERGFRVTTTLDYILQEKAEEIVKRNALSNKDRFNAENAALVAIDPQTGEILSMVGSRDYFDPEIDGNFNAAIDPNRQPGSAFKPFVYAQAFKEGYTPETVVFDLKTQFSTACSSTNFTSDGECYSPGNYDNDFRGPVTLREALAQSINIPSVKVLYLTGMRDAVRLAQSMGIKSLADISRYGLTLVLGGGEVSLLDMTSAYGVFANEGVRNSPTSVLRIEDADGNVVEESSAGPIRVLEANITRMISDVLSDNEARAPLYGSNSPLLFNNYDVAAKTGTTNDLFDAWIVGYSPTLAVGVWAGNNTPESMTQISGLIVTPMWREFMDVALPTRDRGFFREPNYEYSSINKPILKGLWRGGNSYIIDTLSGKLATEYTPEETREERVVGEVHSILHWVDKNDPRGPIPSNPERDSQYFLWEYPISLWKERNNITGTDSSSIPNEIDDIHLPQFFPRVSFLSPSSNSEVERDSRVNIQIEASGRYSVIEATYYLNGTFVGSSQRTPFSVSFIPSSVEGIRDENTLTVVVKDAVFNKGETSVPLRISF